MEDFGVLWNGNSVGIPTGFSVGMGWEWEFKSNSHGSPAFRGGKIIVVRPGANNPRYAAD